jgi:transcriptional regulator with XRE-family HTH domain
MAKKSNKSINNIGERIRYIRGPLTMPEFGKEIDANRNTVANWESNRGLPMCEYLLQMHNKFNVNINWLLTGKGEPYLREIDNKVLKMDTRLSVLEKKFAELAKRKRP